MDRAWAFRAALCLLLLLLLESQVLFQLSDFFFGGFDAEDAEEPEGAPGADGAPEGVVVWLASVHPELLPYHQQVLYSLYLRNSNRNTSNFNMDEYVGRF